MSVINEAIYSRLSADANIMAIVGTRIFPSKATQNQPPPLIMYFRVDTVPATALNTASTFMASRFQFDCWHKTEIGAETLAEKVKTSLDGFIGTILGITIGGIVFLDQFDDYDDDAELYRVGQYFRILHSL